MDVHSLAARLRDPNPQVRVETLRILAMVEETRALEAIRWIYLNDPEQGVRDVADWAGRVIWTAEKRGHSTQKAIQEMFARPLSPEREAAFLAAMERIGTPFFKKHAAERYASDQNYRRLMDATLREADDVPRQLPAGDIVPPPAAQSAAAAPAATEPAGQAEPDEQRYTDLFSEQDLSTLFDDTALDFDDE